MIDLKSDTVTRPTPEMMAAIANAPVGDDVTSDDPSVNRLEEVTASMLNKEAAVYMPSGTMTNQVAVRIHCKPGDEFICETECHVFNHEQAAFAQLSGVAARPIEGERGVWDLQQLRHLVRQDFLHETHTRLVALENTHNRGGGAVLPFERVVEICSWAHDNNLRTHLDGARLFNAVVASGIDVAQWTENFDTVSVCFSKGLGAPVGSALAGPEDMMREARRHRKALGGGMRQAGVIAAAALYALENHVDRLAEDHANAQILAEAIDACEGLSLRFNEVETNIVIFDVHSRFGSAADFVDVLYREGIRSHAVGPQSVRLVTHLDVSRDDVRQAADRLKALGA